MNDEFKIGDWVKYLPTPYEQYTECVETIARGLDNKVYLCLSNGKYVPAAYCIKYKIQGEERMKLIDKLNATL